MIGGQTVDVLSSKKKININTLRYIHLKKTGALLQAATELACVVFEADENLTITLSNFALNLGLAYQIVDDILDEVGSYDVLGKEPGSDTKGNKATYPSLIGLEKSKKIPRCRSSKKQSRGFKQKTKEENHGKMTKSIPTRYGRR